MPEKIMTEVSKRRYNSKSKKMQKKSETVPKSLVKKTTGKYAGEDVVAIDIDKLESLVKSHNLTKIDVCKSVGISQSSFSNWRKRGGNALLTTVQSVAEFFNVNVMDLLKTDEKPVIDDSTVFESDITNTVVTDNIENQFRNIDTLNIHEALDIINSNIFTAFNVLQNNLYAYIDSKFDALHNELFDSISNLYPQLEIDDDVEEDVNSSKPIAFHVSVGEIANLVSGFSWDDDFEAYKKKIYRMAAIIACYKKCPRKSVLHSFYIEMTNTYGVVYDQLKKEYYANYQHASSGSTELIYEDNKFRQIFYNLISDMLKVCAQKDGAEVVKHNKNKK